MTILAAIALLLAGIGLTQGTVGLWALGRFRARMPAPAPRVLPGVTVLKPLYGDEALLEVALASNFRQTYPEFQLVFGVKSPDDAALGVVERLRARFPDVDVAVVICPDEHGANRKIGNLINMLSAAKHDVLVIADSDVHVAPTYLGRLVACLALPQVGLVTTLYTGLAASRTMVARLGATAISHGFLPGALLARELGRQDCLGATMALRRDTLGKIGGLRTLVDHLADDYMLGRLVLAHGLRVHLADAVVATTVPETRFGHLFRHELRWARTIRAVEPIGFAASAVQYPLAWAAFAVVLSGGAIWAVAGFGVAWLGRALIARGLDARLGLAKSALATPAPFWLLPLRDLMSILIMLASVGSDRVEWRGTEMHADHAELPINENPPPHASVPQRT
ncbi:MAG: bacteriohopanetetrol glucosamine biosynthesis glycosyltransferase HpnI [Acetobacteraceae bacterium]|nr:bacteriohopanetetrol glucosamine biosynthesis glycosyltransferase HpnI [Acetobacteraceae bacterium]